MAARVWAMCERHGLEWRQRVSPAGLRGFKLPSNSVISSVNKIDARTFQSDFSVENYFT